MPCVGLESSKPSLTNSVNLSPVVNPTTNSLPDTNFLYLESAPLAVAIAAIIPSSAVLF